MATYKVLQDIEAEDHILGPLTLRQFIFSLISVFFLYLSFIVVVKGAAFLLVVFLPPALLSGFFAFPFGKDQPTEIWALAKIRFYFKPRKRIWNQSGVKELVTITAPKRVEVVRTNGLSQNEVKSRLSALAHTIDSRGWSIKNVNVNLYSQPSQYATDAASDRLVDISAMPQPVADYEVYASDDILDERSNPIAQQFDQMINASSSSHRKKLIDTMNSHAQATPAATAQTPENYWFLNPTPPVPTDPTQAVFAAPQVVQPQSAPAQTAAPAALTTDAEQALLEQVKKRSEPVQAYNAHMKTIQPFINGQPAPSTVTTTAQPSAPKPMTATPDPAIIKLASNNDLNVATLAREASRVKNPQLPKDEVVISLR